MAAALVTFAPSNTAPFTFNATLDGASYNLTVPWNYAGQRYYIECYTVQGVRIFTLPLIGSPDDYNISITAGYFTSPLIYRVSSNQFEIG